MVSGMAFCLVFGQGQEKVRTGFTTGVGDSESTDVARYGVGTGTGKISTVVGTGVRKRSGLVFGIMSDIWIGIGTG